MKELSIEEKAKRYDEAVKRVENIKTGKCETIFMFTEGLFEYIFPELKESEDERVRKEIIYHIQHCDDTIDEETEKRMLAWLEKQGEQKPADKVEPKFKVGDWVVVDDGRTGRIIECTKDYADVDLEFSCLSTRVNNIRSWTIQEAKDGDVLIDKSDSRECPFMFKETKPSDIKTDMLNPLTVLGYCGIGGAGFTKGSGWGDTANCIYYPATKEQREQLKKVMADAGYTFDFEKKELKKIEQKPVWSEDDESIALGIEQLCNCASLLNIAPDKIDKIRTWLKSLKNRVQPKPQKEWSDEDTRLQRKLIELIYSVSYCDERENLSNWLKHLKDKVQPKQEWSEEDESHIRYLIECLEHCKKGVTLTMTTSTAQEYINWLKSLRPQPQWKPSEEQMNALHDLNLTGNISYTGQGQELVNLYNDLKKLREE